MQDWRWSYAPYPTPLEMDPMSHMMVEVFAKEGTTREAARAVWERPDTRIVLTPMRPIAHFRRVIEFHDVRLADYRVMFRTETRIVSQ